MSQRRIKGLAKARKGARLRAHSHEALSGEAIEVLFRSAEVFTEGEVREAAGGGRSSWFGSAMISFDLDALAAAWRGTFDDAARDAAVRAIEGSVQVRVRAMRIACHEVARRLPDQRLGTAQVETRVRRVGRKLHLDVDLEVPLGVSSSRRRDR